MTCCAPARVDASARVEPLEDPAAAAEGQHRIEQSSVPAQTFAMGDLHGDGAAADGEGPAHDVALDAFAVDATTVTNDDFAAFVEATGHRTDAERHGTSAVFHLATAVDNADVVGRAAGTPWWVVVRGADWAHPQGRHSDLTGLADHPVVHASWRDAQAYCHWAGRQLPTEAQWECAARGGRLAQRFPWGDSLGSQPRCNIWQGTFPTVNTLDDGYLTTAPVRTFEPNGYGLWQTVGNVWEWCADWWDHAYYRHSPRENPPGPPAGERRAMRGGSFLCHDSYCSRYRNAARSANTPESSAANIGFRTVGRTHGSCGTR